MKLLREHMNINEKFVEDSDPVEDLGLGIRKQISKFMKELDEEDTDDNALAECAANGKTEWVKFLLARGANVHFVENYALRLAAANGRTETVQVILDASADVHAIDDQALRYAAYNGHTETVKVLLDAGADVHAIEDQALHIAAENGSTEIVKMLLDAGANVHAAKDYALRSAAANGHAETVQVLKDHIAKEKEAKKVKESLNEKFVEDSDPVEDLGIGTRKQISKFMEELNEDDTDNNALAECGAAGKTEWVKFLLARGANVHFVENYALRYAAENGYTETVKVLLDDGADVHAVEDYALRWAARNGHTETVKVLLDAGANVHAVDDWALRSAAANGHTETFKVLKDHIVKEKEAKKVKENLNEKFVEDSDPVDDLGIGPRKKISEWLKENNKEDTDDNALSECAANGKTEWVKYLLDKGVTFKYAPYASYSFYYAIIQGYTEIVKMLIDKAKIYKLVDIKSFVYLTDKYNHPEIKSILQDYLEKYHNYMNTPIKEDLNEKFSEDSDPVHDLGIGKCQQKLNKIRKYLADAWDEGYSYIAFYNESTPEIDAKMDLIDGLKEILDEE